MLLHSNEEFSVIDNPAAIAEDIRDMKIAIERLQNGELKEDDFRKFRIHRGIYGQRSDQSGFNMVRVKVPSGVLTSKQLKRIGEIAHQFADGIAHITTRQDIQFHWVKLGNVPTVLASLADVGLTTRESGGNAVRNIINSPLAGVSYTELFDVTPYAQLLAKHLLRNEKYQQLPRKFKISFSGSLVENDEVIPWIHDVGFAAAVKQEGDVLQKGFKVFVGGGLGSQPRIADLFDDFLPIEQLIPTAEAILNVFNALGNREKRDKARLKYLLWNIGIEKFRSLVNDERTHILRSDRLFVVPEETPETGYIPLDYSSPSFQIGEDIEFRQWASSKVIPQKQDGYNVVFVNVNLGNYTTDQLLGLSALAEHYSNGFIRTTVRQDIILRWIRSSDLKTVYEELKRRGLQATGMPDYVQITSCPGAATCNLAITHSRALADNVKQYFQNTHNGNEILKGLRIKISGCQNSCGQHHIADIGFHGASKNVNGRQIPSYIISVGGGLNTLPYKFGETIGKIPARYAVEAASRILKRFLSERLVTEDFHEFVNRLGVQALRQDVKQFADIGPENMNDTIFVDLGQKTAFAAVIGESECAA